MQNSFPFKAQLRNLFLAHSWTLTWNPIVRNQGISNGTRTAVISLFVLRLLVVIEDFAWELPSDEQQGYLVNEPDGAVIAFYLFKSLSSAASFLGIAMTRFWGILDIAL